ncbi:MAG: hypothetical protein QW728_07085, partial [Thermoplasmata archaeon]
RSDDDYSRSTNKTADDGKCVFGGEYCLMAGQYIVVAKGSGKATSIINLTLAPEEVKNLTILMNSSLVLTGRVIWNDSVPIDYLPLKLQRQDCPEHWREYYTVIVATDKNGSFTIDSGLSAGNYNITPYLQNPLPVNSNLWTKGFIPKVINLTLPMKGILTITLDPLLHIISPANNTVFFDTDVVFINGITAPSATVDIVVNNRLFSSFVLAGETFTTEVPLQPGNNTITVYATMKNTYNTAQNILTLIRYTPPVITVGLDNEALITQNDFIFNGTVSSVCSNSVFLNISFVPPLTNPVVISQNNFSWTCRLSLTSTDNGRHLVNITATDSYGVRSSRFITVIVAIMVERISLNITSEQEHIFDKENGILLFTANNTGNTVQSFYFNLSSINCRIKAVQCFLGHIPDLWWKPTSSMPEGLSGAKLIGEFNANRVLFLYENLTPSVPLFIQVEVMAGSSGDNNLQSEVNLSGRLTPDTPVLSFSTIAVKFNLQNSSSSASDRFSWCLFTKVFLIVLLLIIFTLVMTYLFVLRKEDEYQLSVLEKFTRLPAQFFKRRWEGERKSPVDKKKHIRSRF